MLHGTVWDAPSAGSKKKLLLNQVRFVTSNCTGSAVRQFEKEVSFRLETGVGYVTWDCVGRAVRQFEKEVSFKLGTGVENVTSNCMGRAVRQLASPQTSFGVRLSRIHFSPTDVC